MRKNICVILSLIMCLALSGCQCRHEWGEATCLEAQVCQKCQEIQGEPLGHSWQDPSCEHPKTCIRCAVTEGDTQGHSWQQATCDKPKTCGSCGKVEGEALGHSNGEWTIAEDKMLRICSICGSQEDCDINWEIYLRSKLAGCWTVESYYDMYKNLCEGNGLNRYWDYDPIYINFLDEENAEVCGITGGTTPKAGKYTLEEVKDEDSGISTYLVKINVDGQVLPLYVASYESPPSFTWQERACISSNDPEYVGFTLTSQGDRLALLDSKYGYCYLFSRDAAELDMVRAWELLEGTWILDPTREGEESTGENLEFTFSGNRGNFVLGDGSEISGIWKFSNAGYYPDENLEYTKYILQYETMLNDRSVFTANVSVRYETGIDPYLELYLQPMDSTATKRRIMYYTKENEALENVLDTGNFSQDTHLAGTWVVDSELSLVIPSKEALDYRLIFHEDGSYQLKLDQEFVGKWEIDRLSNSESGYSDYYNLSIQGESIYESMSVSVTDHYRDQRDVVVLYCRTKDGTRPEWTEYRFVRG